MALNTKSIRTKMLGLLAFIALVVGGLSVLYDLRAGGGLIRDEIVKRGRYVLEQFLHHHQNLETTFFGAVVDSVLMAG